jgi:tRNA-Thr(GGU) m(6)t(6)A37 methyltransferase TsaA
VELPSFVVRPIGVVRSPFVEKVQAPRQATAAPADGIEGTIELLPEHEHALADLAGFERIWVVFWFHLAPPRGGSANAKAKVLPPRSDVKRGVFATRSPHRPNPIGLSAVRLVGVEGRRVTVRDLDLLDGTPVLDLKPYLPYADAFPEASAGWLEPRDPISAWTVALADPARDALAWIAEHDPVSGKDLAGRIVETLALGPQPHPYRRIKNVDGQLVLAVKAWRARFVVFGRTIRVERIRTGYRGRDLHAGTDPDHDVHRAFTARFG